MSSFQENVNFSDKGCFVVFFFSSAIGNPCSNNPCKNNGACTSSEGSGFKCTCTGGYTGATCETGTVLLFFVFDAITKFLVL